MSISAIFKDSLPEFINSQPKKGSATVYLPKAQAIQLERFKAYQNDRHFFMVDHDKAPCRAERLYDIEPNIVVYNVQNPERHQAFWLLKDPVHCQAKAKACKPYRYMRAIEAAYDAKYQADIHFARYIHRNPLFWAADTDWRHDRAYTLSELAEVVDMQPERIKRGQRLVTDGGRNNTLFNDLRSWAYPNALVARQSSYDEWHKQIVTRAIAYNTFDNPLPLNETLVVARSVAEFTYFRYRQQGAAVTDAYRELQAQRGAIGGKKSKGGGRKPAIDAENAQRIDLMLSMSYTHSEIADRIGVSTKAIQRYIAATNNVK
ncbi:replication initiation protein [Vibrio parahaemolyticus]